MTAPRPCLHVVPQLRWSREGDRSQPESDERLGPVLDDALRQLEEGRLPHLHLDGPLVLIEDWLAQAPAGERDQRRARIAQQVAAGRLAVGPWLVHTDPALASAELQEWNLRLGLELGDALGGAPRVGDLRHTSGPTAGVPSLLRRFGIHTAVLQRGIPAHHSGSWLRWSAPDGAEVTALWLPPVPEADAAVRFLGAERAPLDAELGARLTQLGATADMRCGSLAAFLATAPEPTTLPELRGELRDPRRVGTWPRWSPGPVWGPGTPPRTPSTPPPRRPGGPCSA